MNEKDINKIVNQLKFFGNNEKAITHKPLYDYTSIFTNKGIYLMSGSQEDLAITLFADIEINPNKEVLSVDNTLYFECIKDKQTYSIAKTGKLNELGLIKYCKGYLDLIAENARFREALEKIAKINYAGTICGDLALLSQIIDIATEVLQKKGDD